MDETLVDRPLMPAALSPIRELRRPAARSVPNRKETYPLKIVPWIAFLAGLAATSLLVAWQGVETIAGWLAAADWRVLLVAVLVPADLLFSAASWGRLFPPGRVPRLRHLVAAQWIGGAVNNLLPVATIGGEVVKARLLMHWSTTGVDATASVTVDKTVQAIAVLLWAVIGAAVLMAVAPGDRMVTATVVGIGLLAIGILGFVLVQVAGAFGGLARVADRLRGGRWGRLVAGATSVDGAIRALYGRPGAILWASLLRLGSRIVVVGEALIAAWVIGHPITATDALLITSLGMSLRAAAFVVPAGLGIQEGAFIVVGALIGQPADVTLTISLILRLPEIVIGIPGLFAWQHLEGRAFWRRHVARRRDGGRAADGDNDEDARAPAGTGRSDEHTRPAESA